MELDEIVVKTDRLDFPALAAGDGQPVVCWHGFPDHPATFGPLAEYLVAAGRRVVAPFLRGLHPATLDATTYVDSLTLAADAAAVAAALAPDSDGVDMIGHDIGAGMVHRVAAAWPERLRRGVTMAVPPPPAIGEMFTDPAQLQRAFYIWLFQLESLPDAILEADRRLVDHLWRTWSPGWAADDSHRDRVHQVYGDPRFIRTALRIYRANFDTTLHDPELAALAERTETVASKPLLMLGGADDGCIDARFIRFAGSGLATGSRIDVLDDVGHFLHLERPDAVADRALAWFNG